MHAPSNPPPNGPKGLAQLAMSAVGLLAGLYAGIHVLVPGAAIGAVWWLGSRWWQPAQPAYLHALATQAGHLVWMGLGMALTRNWDATLGDVVVLAVALGWLWLRPGRWPLGILVVYQVVSLAVNGFMLIEQPVGSMPHKALVVHIGLRVAALFYLWRGFRATRQGPPADA